MKADTAQPVRSADRFLVFGAPLIGESEIDEVVATLRSGWLGTGPKVKMFEAAMAEYTGSKHAIAVNSCTAALHLSLLAAGVGPGDEVITTPMTFCATVNAIIHCGATPVLADIDPSTFNIDPNEIQAKLSPKTKAVVPVHFAGRLCDMAQITAIAEQNNLQLIEDCAHAIETTSSDGQKAGTFGNFGCFSFYVTKNVVTGEGGMIVTDDDDLAQRLRILSLHGMSKDAWKRFGNEGFKHYQVVEPGFKYNMMDIQAAIGIHQLARIESTWLRRQDIWARYQEAFKSLPLLLPADVGTDKHAYHLYTIGIDLEHNKVSRDAFLDRMTWNGIGVGVHYLSLPEHEYYQKEFGWHSDDFPHARDLGRSTVSLPLSPAMTDADVEDVINSVMRSLD
jgi:dTDP-4-amino-4,6-dideoxygalactose transaminase